MYLIARHPKFQDSNTTHFPIVIVTSNLHKIYNNNNK